MTAPAGPEAANPTRAGAAGVVLVALVACQFVMVLDTSVMNVSMVEVAKDLGADITGIQTAITLYTLVMASFMLTGGKLGQILGRKRAFIIGCVVYGAGSLTTALSQNLAMLLVGWSLLEGLGAALILPAIVALVASNFTQDKRPRAYGMLAAAAAVAVTAGPLIGGVFTTYLSWRWVFLGEVIALLGVLVVARRIADTPPTPGTRLDLGGTVASAAALGLFVFGLLRSSAWGFLHPKPGAPEWFGLSPSFWLMVAGGIVGRLFFIWEGRVIERGKEPLLDPMLLENLELRAGLLAFFFQFLLQFGLFYLISLFLLVALGLSPIGAGLQLMAFSVTLLAAALGVPKRFPDVSPRRVVRLGFAAFVVGLVTLIMALNVGSGPDVVTWPLLIAGLGAGMLASQLGSVTVSSVPDDRAGEVGGLQNTATNLGSSIATALTGAVLISALTTSFLTGIQENPDVPEPTVASAEVELEAGVPFLSDRDLAIAMDEAGVPPAAAASITAVNTAARVRALQSALGVLLLIAVVALFTSGKIPVHQPGRRPPPA